MYIHEDLDILKNFIPVLIQKESYLRLENLNSEKKILIKMFDGLIDIDRKRNIFIKENAPNFNIFNILRYGYYETRLHTPFLVHLLSPDGHHLFDTQFLKYLIDSIFSPPPDVAKLSNIEVTEELISPKLNGRIDIFISFSFNSERYFIAIENKINAYDQEDQLSRYYDFLKLQTDNHDHIRLVYLTKRGDEPDFPFSIEKETFDLLYSKNTLVLLSYKRDIASWISQILQNKNPLSVSAILKQYLQIINNF
jgi:hypothetical protein